MHTELASNKTYYPIATAKEFFNGDLGLWSFVMDDLAGIIAAGHVTQCEWRVARAFVKTDATKPNKLTDRLREYTADLSSECRPQTWDVLIDARFAKAIPSALAKGDEAAAAEDEKEEKKKKDKDKKDKKEDKKKDTHGKATKKEAVKKK